MHKRFYTTLADFPQSNLLWGKCFISTHFFSFQHIISKPPCTGKELCCVMWCCYNVSEILFVSVSCGLFNFEKEISGFSSRCVSRLKKNLHKNGFFASLCVSQCHKTFFIHHESKGGFRRVWFEQCSNLKIFAIFLCFKKNNIQIENF